MTALEREATQMIDRRKATLLLVCVGSLTLAACDDSKLEPAAKPPASAVSTAPTAMVSAAAPLPPMPVAPPLAPPPDALPPPKTPADNPLTPEGVALGKQLFFDKRLSKDGSASCETCHVPEKGWTDGKQFSTKVGGGVNTRHSPTLYNASYNDLYYWDGRSPTLEKQIEAAWKGQMGADPATIAAALAKIPLYEVQFKTIYKRDVTPEDVIKAIASFVRTIRSADSPWDKYEKGDKKAVGDDATRGWELFRNKAGCAACHVPPMFSDGSFHDVGVGFDKPEPDLGRGKITKNDKENGAFKTPTLRSVTAHPPYFHDGHAASIDDAVDFILKGGIKDKNPNLDPQLKPVKLSAKERTDLLAFVKALEPAPTPFERPKLPE
jgi:cytochrome c peroxidase